MKTRLTNKFSRKKNHMMRHLGRFQPLLRTTAPLFYTSFHCRGCWKNVTQEPIKQRPRFKKKQASAANFRRLSGSMSICDAIMTCCRHGVRFGTLKKRSRSPCSQKIYVHKKKKAQQWWTPPMSWSSYKFNWLVLFIIVMSFLMKYVLRWTIWSVVFIIVVLVS